jgi:excisionase family DNA binding protein
VEKKMKIEKEKSVNKRYLKVEHAAEMLDVSVWTIRKWIKERRLCTYRFGRAVRINVEDLLGFANVTPSDKQFIEQQKIP